MKATKSLRSPLIAVSGVLFLLGGAPACVAPSSSEEGAAEPIGEAVDAITGSTVVANGEEWVNAKLHYCQAKRGAVDGDSSCWAWEGASHVCDRQSNAAWNPYRSDCSGFITWSWGLPPVGDGGYVTGDFAPYSTSFSHVIQAASLEAGDAANLNAGGHIVLFKQWVTPGTEAIFLEEPGCSSSEPYAHQFTSAVTVSGSNIYIAYEGESFTAIRYNGLTAAASDWAASFVSQSWPLATTTMPMTVNQVIPASITLKNTGTKSWDAKTKIGTTQPRDRTSPFAGADWLSPSRLVSLPAGTTVAPGQTHEFKFSFYAPNTPGSFDEFYGVVEEGVAWFSDAGQGGPADNDLEVKIKVSQAAYHGQFVSQTFPTLAKAPLMMTVGQTLEGTITMKNIGTAIWKAGVTKLAPTARDKPSALGSMGWLSTTRVSSPPADVPPGGSFAFPLELTASKTGDFTQTFSLVEEGVTWFADAPKGGGPTDDALAVHVVVTEASDMSSSGTSAEGAGGAGTGGSDTGAGVGTTDGVGGDATSGPGAGGNGGAADTSASSSNGDPNASNDATGSCAIGTPHAPDSGLVGWLSAMGVAILVSRRRRRAHGESFP